MQLNIINYILENTSYKQKDIAAKCKVEAPTVTGWKKGGKILQKHSKVLYQMAGLSVSEKESQKWAIISKSLRDSEDYYKYMSQFFECTGLFIIPPSGGATWEWDINYDSLWVDRFKRMLVIFNEAGIKINEKEMTYPVTFQLIHNPNGEDIEQYTNFDYFVKEYSEHWTIYKKWYEAFISKINLDKHGTKIQIQLWNELIKLPIANIMDGLLLEVGLEVNKIKEYHEEVHSSITNLLTELCESIKKNKLTLEINYFDLINLDLQEIQSQYYKPEKQSNSDFDDLLLSYAEQKILEGIKKNEVLLKKLLKRMDNYEKKK